jgi:hypothetical protein
MYSGFSSMNQQPTRPRGARKRLAQLSSNVRLRCIANHMGETLDMLRINKVSRHLWRILCVSFPLIWFCSHVHGQLIVEIRTTDGVDTVLDTLGVYHGATECPDATYDGHFVEEELPPVPPVGLDVRFVDYRPWSSCMGQGTRLNLQGGEFGNEDTFWLRIHQPDSERYPIRFDWTHIDLSPGDILWRSMQMTDTVDGSLINLNMLSDTSYSISDPSIHTLQVITRTTIAGNVRGDVATPGQFRLLQNYPNPFNNSTIISYHLDVSSFVELSIFDYLGRQVATPVKGRETPGAHSVAFSIGNLSSGVYIARLRSETFFEFIRILCLR